MFRITILKWPDYNLKSRCYPKLTCMLIKIENGKYLEVRCCKSMKIFRCNAERQVTKGIQKRNQVSYCAIKSYKKITQFYA
jgi:hypothetical protein